MIDVGAINLLKEHAQKLLSLYVKFRQQITLINTFQFFLDYFQLSLEFYTS